MTLRLLQPFGKDAWNAGQRTKLSTVKKNSKKKKLMKMGFEPDIGSSTDTDANHWTIEGSLSRLDTE